MGNCSLIHEEKLKNQYQAQSEYSYTRIFYEKISRLAQDLDRTIRKGNERLSTKGPLDQVDTTRDEFNEKIFLIEKQISDTISAIEEAGEQGRVTEAQSLMAHQTALQAQISVLKGDENQNPDLRSDIKKMNVCEVCGAFLIVGDCQQRIDAHMEGKQHVGYKRIREKVDDMKGAVFPPAFSGSVSGNDERKSEFRQDRRGVERGSEQRGGQDRYSDRRRPDDYRNDNSRHSNRQDSNRQDGNRQESSRYGRDDRERSRDGRSRPNERSRTSYNDIPQDASRHRH